MEQPAHHDPPATRCARLEAERAEANFIAAGDDLGKLVKDFLLAQAGSRAPGVGIGFSRLIRHVASGVTSDRRRPGIQIRLDGEDMAALLALARAADVSTSHAQRRRAARTNDDDSATEAAACADVTDKGSIGVSGTAAFA